MASEIRVDKITSLSGVGTITPSPTGIEISGITTVSTLKATTGIVTSLTAGSLTSLGAVSGTTGTFSSDVSVAGDFQVPDVIKHEGDVDTRIRFPAADTITAETGGTERLRITSDGNIGVNVTPTNYSNYVTLGLNDSTGSTIEGRVGGTLTGSFTVDSLVTINAVTSIPIVFKTANTERLRISSTGQLSVGTTADVDGVNVAIGGSVRLVNATGQSATITALPSGTYNTGVSGGSAIVFHRFSDSGGGSDEIAFETHHQGTRHGEAARFNKTGNLAFPSGQGVDFSATSGSGTSELFDDYEEGTWTPAYTSTNGTFAYTTQTGYYTKVGNQVSVSAYIRTSSVSSTGHNLIKVSGLPFAEGKNQRTPGSLRVSSSGFQGSGFDTFPVTWSVEAGQSFGELQRFTNGGNTDQTTSTMNNASFVYAQCTYHTA